MEKLSALGELASGVAHDFNNTLAGILGRAQLLQRTDDPEKVKRGLDIIIKTAEDGAKTVKRIQDFARQRRDHNFELVSIDQILMDASEITRPRWKNCAEASNIHITLELQIDSNAMVMGDDSELREVLVNMVFNAIDAMPEGGRLTLIDAHRRRLGDRQGYRYGCGNVSGSAFAHLRSVLHDEGQGGSRSWSRGELRHHQATQRQHRSRIAVWRWN